MSLRRLRVLIAGLPRNSSVARALHGEVVDWSADTYLLARIANIVHQTGSSKRIPASQLVRPPGTRRKAAFDIGIHASEG